MKNITKTVSSITILALLLNLLMMDSACSYSARSVHSSYLSPQSAKKRLNSKPDATSRMGITKNDLANLGLIDIDWLSGSWKVRGVFERFLGAPPEVIEALKKKLINPSCSQEQILHSHDLINEIVTHFQATYEDQAIEKLKLVIDLITRYSAAKAQFYREHRVLRNNHYPPQSSNWLGNIPRDPRYPEVAYPLVPIAKMIAILHDLGMMLPEGVSEDIQRWKRNLKRTLSRPEFEPFFERLDFVKAASGAIAEGPHYGRGFGDVVTMFFDREVEEELLELCEQFDDLWVIPTGAETDKYMYLRQFPASKMHSPLADIYYYCRLALLVLDDGWSLPDLNQPQGTVKLNSFKNPLIAPQEHMQKRATEILFPIFGAERHMPIPEDAPVIEPISIELGGDKSSLLLTGPNMGGKTTTARGIGIAVLLAQIGFPIPDDHPEIASFNNIYTVFPRPEQLQAGYGYFATLIRELTDLLKKAGPGDLIILDEVPVGTEYRELVAIATVLIEDLINTGATVVATGHLKKAFELVAERTGQQPYMHTVKEVDGEIVPDFGLTPGIAEHSYAIELAAQAGFPSEVIDLARSYYGVITRGDNSSAIPGIVSVDAADRERTSFDPDDAELIKAVASNLYPQSNFIFPDNHKSIVSTLTSALSLRTSPDDKTIGVSEDGRRCGNEVIDNRLQLTGLFLSQEESFLKRLDSLLQKYAQMAEPKSWWEQTEFSIEEVMDKLAMLEEFLQELVSHLSPLSIENEDIAVMIEAFNEILSDQLPELCQKYQDEDTTDFDDGDWNKLNSVWKGDWQTLLKGVMNRGCKVLDYYAGIAKSNIEYGLKPPKFSRELNVFSLNNSKPFFPDRWSMSPFVDHPVKQSFTVNPDKSVMVLTGPNSSGKSVMMFNSRMNALLALNGFYVSGDLEMSMVDNVYAFFGGRDEVTAGESYFLNIIGRYVSIINNVTPNSLVILDELHGTDYFELAALQVAVLHYLRSTGCTVIFNTHVRDGLKLADEKVGLDFWKTDVEYDAQHNNVTPNYTLSPDPDLKAKSYGLAIASQWLTVEQAARVKEILAYLDEEDSDLTPAAGLPIAEVADSCP